MLKERAASALEHGLPVPPPPPARVKVADILSSSSSASAPLSGRSVAVPNRRMPLAVKLLGLALLLLGVVYGLTLFRDRRHEEVMRSEPESEPTPAVEKPNPTPGLAVASASNVPAQQATQARALAPKVPALAADRLPLAAALSVPSAHAGSLVPPAPAPSPKAKALHAVSSAERVGTPVELKARGPSATSETPGAGVPPKADNPY